MLIILYSTNYMLTILSLPIEVCANSNNDLQSLASNFRLIYVNHFLLLVQVSERSTLYFIYSKQRTCFRHLCLHFHHHTPMENLRRYFSHTKAHKRFYSTRMTRKYSALCFGQSTPLWLISMGLRLYHIRCPYDILLLLAQLSHCTSKPTSLITADKRDYILDARFHHRGTETSRVRTAVRTSTPVQERPSSTSSLAFLLRIDTVAYTPRNAYVSTSTQTQIDRRDRPCLTSP